MDDIKLFLCKRMSANISERQCKINQGRNDGYCRGCAGLGEEVDMPNVKRPEGQPVKFPCKVDGCVKSTWKSGYCYKHHPDYGKAKPVAAPAPSPAPAAARRPDPVATSADLVGMMVGELRAIFDERLLSVHNEMMQTTSAVDRARLFLRMAESIGGL